MNLTLSCFNSQFVIASKLGDAALDREVKRRTRSFDSQMRILVKAMTVLSAALPTDDLRPADRFVLDRLRALGQRADMDAAGGGAEDAAFTTADVDDLIDRLRRLRQEDPESAYGILRRLVDETVTPANTGRW